MKAKTYEVCNREKVEWQAVILIVSDCKFERRLQYIGCIYRKKGSQSEINVYRHYSVSAVTGWCVCVCVCVCGRGSCQQSLSDCIVCAHYSVSMCRHTYVNQRRVHDSCCYKHAPHSCRLHVHKHSAHSTLVESLSQLSSALYTQIPFAVHRFINNYNIPD